MTTKRQADLTCRRIAFAVALVCSGPLTTIACGSEHDWIDGFSENVSAVAVSPQPLQQDRQEPRRLPSVERLPSVAVPARSTEGLLEIPGVLKPEDADWKTRMAFERLELRAADSTADQQHAGTLQQCSAESMSSSPGLDGGITSISVPESGAQVRWLRSSGSADRSRRARAFIDRASIEYGTGAWLSAEATVWDALRCSAEGIDLRDREVAKVQLGIKRRTATDRLQFARTAIREARDFTGVFVPTDGSAISRMAISHSTDVLDFMPCDELSGTDAADRYLDSARVALAEIASQSVEAARAMDLLAAIYLKQNNAAKLHNATALCLRRAALQGQPENASLASRLGMQLLDVGLLEEARWALKHSLSMEKDRATTQAYLAVLYQTGRKTEAQQVLASLPPAPASGIKPANVPEIIELSPQEFVAISKPVMPASARGSVDTNFNRASQNHLPVKPNPDVVRRSDPGALRTIRQDSVEPGPTGETNANIFKRFAESVKKLW